MFNHFQVAPEFDFSVYGDEEDIYIVIFRGALLEHMAKGW